MSKTTPTNHSDLKQGVHRPLLAWFANHQRDLPWRKTRDPYAILLSETLLQQTQVVRGLQYYQRFLEFFPTVQALAAAPLEAVLKAWEGAGYYARARNLHRAAQQMVLTGMPGSLEGWLTLPGVGRYTAGAVCSIALGLPTAVVDGNVRRVLARWYAESNPSETWLWERAEELLEPAQPGDWNQALMELGATLCTPKKPACLRCPVSPHCAAFKQNMVSSVPAPKARASVKKVHAVALVVVCAGAYLLEQRPKHGLLGGMHGVPIAEIEPGLVKGETVALEKLLKSHGLAGLVNHGRWAGTVSHTMTHRQFMLEVFVLELPAGQSPQALVHPQEVALSKLDQKVLAVLGQAALF